MVSAQPIEYMIQSEVAVKKIIASYFDVTAVFSLRRFSQGKID